MQLRSLLPVLGSRVRNRSRHIGALILTAGAVAAIGAGQPGNDVIATVTDLRSDDGQVLACLTAKPAAFPNCEHDPAARRLIVPAGKPLVLDFGAVPNGRYAIALVHDENGNGKLDKQLLMPREGFGFSRDAPVRLGPPSFSRAAFTVEGEEEHQTIRMRYLF